MNSSLKRERARRSSGINPTNYRGLLHLHSLTDGTHTRPWIQEFCWKVKKLGNRVIWPRPTGVHSFVRLPEACWWDLNDGRNSCPGQGWSRVNFSHAWYQEPKGSPNRYYSDKQYVGSSNLTGIVTRARRPNGINPTNHRELCILHSKENDYLYPVVAWSCVNWASSALH